MIAKTNKMWINPPAICRKKPPNHIISKTIAMISIIPI
jgi:hypothetical protein